MNKYTSSDIQSVSYTSEKEDRVQIVFKKEDLEVKSNLSNRYFKEVKKWEQAGGIIEPYNPTPLELKRKAKDKIVRDFKVVADSPVLINGVKYAGGMKSYMRLSAVLQLARDGELHGVQFFDVNNMPHILSISEARQVVVTIGKKYQADFAKRNKDLYELNHGK